MGGIVGSKIVEVCIKADAYNRAKSLAKIVFAKGCILCNIGKRDVFSEMAAYIEYGVM